MNADKAPFKVGQKVYHRGDVLPVTTIFRSDVAPSGWLVECGPGSSAQGISKTGRTTGLMDSSQFVAIAP